MKPEISIIGLLIVNLIFGFASCVRDNEQSAMITCERASQVLRSELRHPQDEKKILEFRTRCYGIYGVTE